jgi:hypothetical protein
MGYPVVHFEIISKIPDKLQAFYSKAFGWSIDINNPMNYGVVDTNAGAGINGGIGPAVQSDNFVTVYVAVPSLDDTLEKAQKLGGTVLMPAMEVMEGLTLAFIADPESNRIGLLLTPQREATGPSKGKGFAVDWFEIGGKDAKGLHTFYGELFEWDLDADNEHGYGQLMAEQGISGGIGPSQGDPYVTFYIATPDLEKSLAAVNRAGGKTVLEPMKVGEDTEIAQFTDPEGNLVGLFKHQH